MYVPTSPNSPETLAHRFLTFFKLITFDATALAKIKQILEQIKAPYVAEDRLTASYNYVVGNTATANRIAELSAALKDGIEGPAAFNKVFAFVQTGDWSAAGVNNQLVSRLLAKDAIEQQQFTEYLAEANNGNAFIRVIRYSNFKFGKPSEESSSAEEGDNEREDSSDEEEETLKPAAILPQLSLDTRSGDEEHDGKPPVSPLVSTFPFSMFASLEVAVNGFNLGEVFKDNPYPNNTKQIVEPRAAEQEAARWLLEM